MQRALRLRRQEDFARLRREGRVWRHPWFTVSAAPNGLAHNRYGFITGKHLGNAVRRNRIRRRLREAVRQLHPQLAPGYDMVFIARQPVLYQPFAAVQEALVSTLQQASLWHTARPGDHGA